MGRVDAISRGTQVKSGSRTSWSSASGLGAVCAQHYKVVQRDHP